MPETFGDDTQIVFVRWIGTGLFRDTGLPLVQFESDIGKLTLVMSCDGAEQVCATLPDYSDKGRFIQASRVAGKAASSDLTPPEGR